MDVKEYVAHLEAIVNIDSGSHYPQGIHKVADYLENLYKKLGWNIVRHDLGPETGPMLEISNRVCDHYDIMFIGHMDTVFPEGTVAQRPFRIEDGRAYGPGVGDMKDGCLAMYHIAKELDSSVTDKLNICMLYNPDEEIGSRYSRDAIDEVARRSDYCFVMEGAGENFTHCFARMGSVGYEIEFHGIAGHAGYIFDTPNASAILELAHWTIALMDLRSRERNTTVNVGVVEGGTASNVVPDYAKLVVNMRMFDESERDRVKARVQELLQKPFVPGVTAKIVSAREAAPMVMTEETERFRKRLMAVAEREGITFNDLRRGGLSDGNHISKCGTVVADGMGAMGGFAHGLKEYSEIDSIVDCVRFSVAVLKDMAKEKWPK